jgi:hypothetical protein
MRVRNNVLSIQKTSMTTPSNGTYTLVNTADAYSTESPINDGLEKKSINKILHKTKFKVKTGYIP